MKTITDTLNAIAPKTMTLKTTNLKTPVFKTPVFKFPTATLVAVAALAALSAQPGLCLDALGTAPDPHASPLVVFLHFIFKLVAVKTVSW